jgi:chemotaxis protein MotA
LSALGRGVDPSVVEDWIKSEALRYEASVDSTESVLESAAGGAPVVGVIGAVMALGSLMLRLEDPKLKIGLGIAHAFEFLIVGLFLSTFFFTPWIRKIRKLGDEESIRYKLLHEGIKSIALGENPQNLGLKLSFLLGGGLGEKED